MPRAQCDEDVIRAAEHLDFVMGTHGPDASLPLSVERELMASYLYEAGSEKYRDMVDARRLERVREAWNALRKAMDVRRAALTMHDDVVELEVVVVRAERVAGDPGTYSERVALKSGNHALMLDSSEVFWPLELKPGMVLQARIK